MTDFQIFDTWLLEISRRKPTVTGEVFVITRNRTTERNFELSLSYDPQAVLLFKEVRSLLNLNFQIPHAVVNAAKEGRRIYPFVVQLMETLHALSVTEWVIDGLPDLSHLTAALQRDVQSLISRGN